VALKVPPDLLPHCPEGSCCAAAWHIFGTPYILRIRICMPCAMWPSRKLNMSTIH